MDEIARLCADLVAAGFNRADDVAPKCRSGARIPPAVARKRLEKPRAGILVQEEGHGLDDGREGLQRALSVLRNSAMALSR